MNTNPTQGQIRPTYTTGDPYAEPFVVPLYDLRQRREWRVIQPDECRVTNCLVCAWRRAGLLDHPKPVVREPDSVYTCRSSFCPGCNAVRCVCPPAGYEDDRAEHAYRLGHEHGTADGPDNRPTRRWLTEAGLDAEPYLAGYDDGCDGLPLYTVMSVATAPTAVLWDDLDDGMPF